MGMTQHRARALVAASAATFLVLTQSGAAMAASDVEVTVRKSVQTLMSPDGTVNSTRLYTQVSANGNGVVQFTDPVGSSLRDLDGFAAPPVQDGKASYDLTVDGAKNLRNLQDFQAANLPITIKATATLDGQPIDPADVVGKSGLLAMTYEVENVTGVQQDISWTDGTGKTVTVPATVPLPYVGTMETILPSSYGEISSPGASLGGTGRGSTKLSYTLILFEPLGSTKATLKYEARVTNADLPEVNFTFLPTAPANNPTTASAQKQYKGGQETGARLTDGATQIDSNLIKLSEGAGTLMAGLQQLYDGSTKLNAGLAGTAAPGAQKLSDGATTLATGLNGKIAPGANQLSAGAAELAAGIGNKLAPGAKKLSAGAGQLATGANSAKAGGAKVSAGADSLSAGLSDFQGGLGKLKAGIDGLPVSITDNEGFKALKGALASVQAGIGSSGDTTTATLLGGLNAIRFGLDNPAKAGPAAGTPCDSSAAAGTANACGIKDALQLLRFGLSNSACDPANPTNPMNPCGAVQGVGQVQQGLETAASSGGNLDKLIGAAKGAYAALVATAGCPTTLPGDPGIIANIPAPAVMLANGILATSPCYAQSSVVYGLALPANTVPSTPDGGVKAQTAAAAAGLQKVLTGLTATAIPGIDKMIGGIGTDADAGTLLNGTARIKGGLSNPLCNPADPKNPANPCGIKEVQGIVSAGLDQLVAGIAGQLSAAVGTPSKGCDPKVTLACGAAALGAGADQLAAGSESLATGLATLSGGASQLSTGAADLSTGVGTLGAGADKLSAGAGTLADGIGVAGAGSSQIADGAGKLAAGLGDAATGSGKIADGLGKAVPGSSKIESGAQQLSTEGTQKLITAGQETTNSFGEKYSVMEALNTRAATGAGIPNGKAIGDNVLTTGAFSFALAGASKDDSNALRFGLAALLLIIAAGAGTVLYNRD